MVFVEIIEIEEGRRLYILERTLMVQLPPPLVHPRNKKRGVKVKRLK